MGSPDRPTPAFPLISPGFAQIRGFFVAKTGGYSQQASCPIATQKVHSAMQFVSDDGYSVCTCVRVFELRGRVWESETTVSNRNFFHHRPVDGSFGRT